MVLSSCIASLILHTQIPTFKECIMLNSDNKLVQSHLLSHYVNSQNTLDDTLLDLINPLCIKDCLNGVEFLVSGSVVDTKLLDLIWLIFRKLDLNRTLLIGI